MPPDKEQAADFRRYLDPQKQRADFRLFLDWCAFYGLPMPADGTEIGHYLMELLMDGATLPDLKRTAASIVAGYEHQRWPLHQPPIRAALEMAADQTDPKRIIN